MFNSACALSNQGCCYPTNKRLLQFVKKKKKMVSFRLLHVFVPLIPFEGMFNIAGCLCVKAYFQNFPPFKQHFIPAGKSGLVAHRFASSLSSIGIASQFVQASEWIHGDLGMSGVYECVSICLSVCVCVCVCLCVSVCAQCV